MRRLLHRFTEPILSRRVIDTGLGFKSYGFSRRIRDDIADIRHVQAANILWASEIQDGDIVFDIGANVGIVSMLAAVKGARVYAFETSTGNMFRLEKNIRLNRMWDRIFPINMAVSDSTGIGRLELAKPHLDFVNGVYLQGHRRGTEETGYSFIQMSTVDDLADQLGCPDHIKIDVDGAEWAVLQGARKTLPKIRSLSLEWDNQQPLNLPMDRIYSRDIADIHEGVFSRKAA